jgi:hypothetical protein
VDCAVIEKELVGFHFGTLGDEERAAVEAHLPGCGGCLRGFLSLKRALETEADLPWPSELARERLRRAVAAEVGRPHRRRRWLLGGAAAVAAVALLAVGALDLAARRRPSVAAPPSSPSPAALDSARAEPASLNVL